MESVSASQLVQILIGIWGHLRKGLLVLVLVLLAQIDINRLLLVQRLEMGMVDIALVVVVTVATQPRWSLIAIEGCCGLVMMV